MNTAKIVNEIIRNLGGNRVELVETYENTFDSQVRFKHAHNTYRCGWNVIGSKLIVERSVNDSWIEDEYSRWIEGVLNGMVRNDAGELVKVCS